MLFATSLTLFAMATWGMMEWDTKLNFQRFSFRELAEINAVLGFTLMAVTLLLFAIERYKAAKLVAAAVIVIGALRLIEYLAQPLFNLDPATFSFTGRRSTTGPLCAIKLILSGTMLASLCPPPIRSARLIAIMLLTLGVLAIALLASFGAASENILVYGRLQLSRQEMPVFIGFIVLGVGILLWVFSYAHQLIPLKRWLPVPVWLAVFLASLFLWDALNAQDYRHAQETVGSAANNAKNQLLDFLNARVNTLKRFGLRWQNQDPPADQWQKSASLLTEDFPDFTSIKWIDRELTVRGIASKKATKPGPIVPNSMDSKAIASALSSGQVTITSVESNGLIHGLLIHVPIHKNAELQGVVVGELNLSAWLQSVREAQMGYRISLEELSLAPINSAPSTLEKEIPLQFYNLAHKLKLSPTSTALAPTQSSIPDAALGAGFMVATLLALLVHLFQTARTHELETRDANHRLMREIVERMRIAQTLRGSQERLAGILRMAQEAIISVDDNQRILLFNSGAEEIFGYANEEVIGHPLHLILPKKFIDDSFGTRRTQERQTEILARRKNGETFYAEASLSKLSLADGIVYTTVLRDISDRKKANEALAESEARYKAMTANVPGVVFQLAQTADGTLHFDYVSRGIEELFLLPAQTIIAHPDKLFSMIVEPPHLTAFHNTRRKSAQTQSRWLWEGAIVVGNEQRKWVSVKASLRPMDRDELVWDGIILDETLRYSAQHEIERSREQLRNLSVHLQAVREDEKAHIAREVHDELGGTLTALKMDIFWLTHKLSADQHDLWVKAQNMEALVDAAVLATRRIVTELRPTILDDLGLVAALRWQANEFQTRMNIRCLLESDADEESEVEKDVALVFFRIFQETLTNVARHSRATTVRIKFYKDRDSFFLEVTDDGVGMDTQQVLNATSNGIRGMYERAHYASGEVTITSSPGAGTTVKVRIPKNYTPAGQRRRALDL